MQVKGCTAEQFSDSGGRRFETLDMKLSAALTTLIDNSPQARQVRSNLYFAESALAKDSRIIKGRQMLWYILMSFSTDESLDECFTIRDLMELRWHGDTPEQVATFRGKYDDILMHMGHPIPEATLLTMTFEKMQNSKVFAEDLAHFRRVGKGSRAPHSCILAGLHG